MTEAVVVSAWKEEKVSGDVMFTTKEAAKLLERANVFFYDPSDEDEEDYEDWKHVINCGDTFAWGCADAEKVEENELVEAATLFWRYGWGGLLYWIVSKRGTEYPWSEFHDVNRSIEYAKREEELLHEFGDPAKSTSERAYAKRKYSIGVEDDGKEA